jgi:protein-S-isoprenylcysteine O-methyltransferase Ste14
MKTTLIIFGLLSIPVFLASLHVLFKPKSHGFYRFFGWECMAWIFSSNYKYWFSDPFSICQIISWIFLLYALYLVIFGVILMKVKGKARTGRKDDSLYLFEKTTVLITTGIYRYIRHPLYGSLIFLAWGICLKNITVVLLIVCFAASIFLFVTMLIEEKENIKYFGEDYEKYMKKSKMFIPYIL